MCYMSWPCVVQCWSRVHLAADPLAAIDVEVADLVFRNAGSF